MNYLKMIGAALTVCATIFVAGCNDDDDNTPDEMVEEGPTEIDLTQVITNAFNADANSDPIEIDDLVIMDDTMNDENAFSTIVQ